MPLRFTLVIRAGSNGAQRRSKHRLSVVFIVLWHCLACHRLVRPLHPTGVELMMARPAVFNPESMRLSRQHREDPAVECRIVVMSVGLLMSGLLFAGIAAAGPAQDDGSPKQLRAGIIGLDTSHVIAFTQLLNAREPKPELAGRSRRGGLSRGKPRPCCKPRSGGGLHERAAR